jgi:carbamoyl-phosphate synthase small subunit
MLVRKIRNKGAMRCIVTDASVSVEEGIKTIEETLVPHDAVRRCSSRKKWYSRTSNPLYNVVAIDCGMKTNIVRMLNRSRCNVTIVPFNTGWEEILSLHPDGVFISNGPGDPCDVPEVIETLKNLRGKIPMFGICLGHQLLSLSYGAKTYKLKFGHRGGNHPVRDVRTGKIEITSQNHSYAVDESSLEGTGLKVSHINVLDNTVEGIYNDEDKVFSVQYHPESAPGPQDSGYLFSRFTDLMKRG